MLKFVRDTTADCSAYDVMLGRTDPVRLARLEQRDAWELPRRLRWSLDFRIGDQTTTLYYDTFGDAREGLFALMDRSLRVFVAGADWHQLRRMALAE